MAESPEIVVTVKTREGRGSAEAGRMRHMGTVPAVVYGGGKPPVPIAVSCKSIGSVGISFTSTLSASPAVTS